MATNTIICQGCEQEMHGYKNVMFVNDLPFCIKCGET